MGYDAPLAVLNERPESLFNYLNNYLQVTNPPIDAYREKIVTSELSYLGGEGNLFHPDETVLDRIQLAKPVLTLTQLDKIKQSKFNVKHLSTLYQDNLKEALERLGEAAIATRDGHTILVLDDSELIDNDDESKLKEQRHANTISYQSYSVINQRRSTYGY